MTQEQLVLGSAQLGCGNGRWGHTLLSRPSSVRCSVLCARDPEPSGTHPPRGHLYAKKMAAEKVWREFFSDPSQWWDHRSEKDNARYPDFKHKKTQQSLWVSSYLTPPWVESELVAMAPGTLQSNSFSWNVKLRRFVKAAQYEKAMELFQHMIRVGMTPDKFTFVPVLNACSGLQSLEEGRRVHEEIIQRGCESDIYVANCLVDMYAKCESIEDAWSVFNNMPERNNVSWGAMIGGYVRSDQGRKAMELFREMQQNGVEADAVTFVGMLNACAGVMALDEGRRVQEQIIRSGYESNVYVATCLVDMYAKCGSMEDAWSVFNQMQERDVVSWSAIIGGYVKCERGLKALELFREMQQEGVEPNAVTFVGVLNACASVNALEEGSRVHELIIRSGCDSDIYIASCLVNMYAKCGSMEDAWSVFSKMRERNVVSWSAIIGGYVKSGQGLKAMELFRKMQQEGVEPDTVTFVGVLNACATVAALEEGRRVHEQIIRRGCESDLSVANCLVDLYAKCGSIDDAWSVFNKMKARDVVSWNAMIGGYAMHGHANKATVLFKKMHKEGVEIDSITFTCLLSACSHGGLVNEGLRYFKSMASCFDLSPTTKHYACMADLLGRAGRLEEAEELMKRVPWERNTSAWMSLLGACRIHGNVEMAERAAKRCRNLDPDNISDHVLLWNIYAAAGKWDSAAIEEERLKRLVWEEPGRTWIEVDNVVHSFVVNDKEHDQILEIRAELQRCQCR